MIVQGEVEKESEQLQLLSQVARTDAGIFRTVWQFQDSYARKPYKRLYSCHYCSTFFLSISWPTYCRSNIKLLAHGNTVPCCVVVSPLQYIQTILCFTPYGNNIALANCTFQVTDYFHIHNSG
jgi:hypothetical protein